MRRLCILASILFATAASVSAQTTPQSRTAPQIVNETVKAARSSLDAGNNASRLSQTDAERLIEACNGLAGLDVTEHELRCSNNPAVAWSLNYLKLPTTKLSARTRDFVLNYARSDRSGGAGAQPTERLVLPADPDARKALSDAFQAEIDQASVAFHKGAERGDIRKRLTAEAKLGVLYRDLREALGGSSSLLPDDPLALSGAEAISAELAALKAYRTSLSRVAANFPLPDSSVTLQSLNDRIDRLNTIVTTDQPGQFYRAREDLERHLDVSRWNQLTASRPKRLDFERQRFEREWSIRYPSLGLPSSSETSQSSEKTSPRSMLSERVLEATRTYETDPARWLALESWLMATHSQIEGLPSAQRHSYDLDPMPSYQQWRASLLTDGDLVLAVQYSLAASNNKSALLRVADEVPFAPDLAHQRYRLELTNALQTELERRKTGSGKETAIPPQVKQRMRADPESEPSLPPAEKLFRVRLAEGRYESPDAMPPLIKALSAKYVQEVHDRDLERATELYLRLQKQNEAAALSTEPLSSTLRQKLEKARNDISAALSRLDDVIKAREHKGYSWQDNARLDLAAMISSLTIRPPPDDSSSNASSPVSTPPPPSHPGSSNSSPSESNGSNNSAGAAQTMIQSDAPLNALFATASQAISETEVANKSIVTQPVGRGADKGKLIVSREQMHSGEVEFATLKRDDSLPRLPDRLQAWNGFVDPVTKKPYDYESEVKNFKDFRPVGGGIHMGDIGILVKPSELNHFVLTYETSSKSLLLVGPAHETYRYGPIEPVDLKVLYQFVLAGHNAAVSIGWAGEYDRDAGRQGEPQPVLLDPYFVDTRIGQDLVAADSIPWALGMETLPGGLPNPIAKKFKTEEDLFYQRQFAILQDFCHGVPKFSDAYANQVRSQFAENGFLDLATYALLTEKNVAAAKASFLEQTEYAKLQRAESQLAAELGRSASSGSLFKLSPDSAQDKSRRAQLAEYKKQEDVIRWFGDQFDRTSDRVELLQGMSALGVETPQADTKWIRLLASTLKGRKDIADDDIGKAVYSALPTTTLAVLLDEPTEIRAENAEIDLHGVMRYRYATSLIRVRNGALVMAERNGKGINKVETIDSLTVLANGAMPVLLEQCASLQRVARYAEVAAFLRWAHRSGSLLGIDFSILGNFASSDREKTPTPDALARSNP